LGVEPDPEDRLAAVDRRMEGIREALNQVLQQLPARERSIVTQHYGFTPDGGSHTLEQIGQLLGVSKERARQLEKRALRKLREIISPSMFEAVLA
jgi:RNA polymerase primary sigma factor